MKEEINEDSAIKISVKALIGIGAAFCTLIGMWFALQADIEEAKMLPEATITRIEYEMKDEIIRNTIMNTQKEVSEIKAAVEKIEDKLYDR